MPPKDIKNPKNKNNTKTPSDIFEMSQNISSRWLENEAKKISSEENKKNSSDSSMLSWKFI